MIRLGDGTSRAGNTRPACVLTHLLLSAVAYILLMFTDKK
jgi:hypothetical protein